MKKNWVNCLQHENGDEDDDVDDTILVTTHQPDIYRSIILAFHDDVIKWKHFPLYWPFVRVSNRSPVNSPHKGQWRGALMFSLICAWTNGSVKNRDAGDLSRHHAHYDVSAMCRSELIIGIISIISNIREWKYVLMEGSLSSIPYTMPTDDLVTQAARASAVMVSTHSSGNFWISALEGLTHLSLEKMADISPTTSSNALSWRKHFNFDSNFTEICF